MKIAVVCANGRVGRLVVKEAIDRELDVTAIAKGGNQTVQKHGFHPLALDAEI